MVTGSQLLQNPVTHSTAALHMVSVQPLKDPGVSLQACSWASGSDGGAAGGCSPGDGRDDPGGAAADPDLAVQRRRQACSRADDARSPSCQLQGGLFLPGSCSSGRTGGLPVPILLLTPHPNHDVSVYGLNLGYTEVCTTKRVRQRCSHGSNPAIVS